MILGTKQAPKLRVNMAEIGYADPPSILETLLGSCIGIAIRDRELGIGALAHIVLPYSDQRSNSPGKFADTAVPAMARALVERGASPGCLEAKLAGGSTMFPTEHSRDIGRKNYETAVEQLEAAGIRLLASHVGGKHGRVIIFDPSDGSLEIYIGRQLTAII